MEEEMSKIVPQSRLPDLDPVSIARSPLPTSTQLHSWSRFLMSKELDSVLGKVQKGIELLPDELRVVVDSFASESSQPKAYLTLSLLWQHARKVEGVLSTDNLDQSFQKIALDYLSETNEPALIRAITFMTAFYRIDADSAFGLLSTEGTLENVMDGVDLDPSPELSLSVARLLAEASGHKKSRGILTAGVGQWLDIHSKQTKHHELAASSTVALVKLWNGTNTSTPGEGQTEMSPDINADALTTQLKNVVVSGQVTSIFAEAVEGLAYLSTKPSIKEKLSKETLFLQRLLESIPARKASWNTSASPINSALLYGIVSIVHNLSKYQPLLSEEQRQIEKLKKLANTSQGSQTQSEEDSTFDDNEYVKARIHRLISANVLPVLSVVAILSDSPAIQLAVGKVLLSIVEEKEVRGRVLQSGGAKALRSIIQRLSPQVDSAENWTTAAIALEPIQALAKLTITAPPIHVYGPDMGAICDAIRPLSLLVLHQSANRLQHFEGIMALTNLASHSPDVANRIANVHGLLNKVELLWLEDHTLICRASMELICNLVSGSETAFQRYAGDGTRGAIPKSKVQVILALCDIEDAPTRLAASGTLAVLASSGAVCRALADLQQEKGRFLSIMISLLSPTPQRDDSQGKEDNNLIHRAAVCIHSLLSEIDTARLAKLKTQADFAKLQGTMAPSKKAGKKVAPAAKKAATNNAKSKVAKADWKEGFKKKQVGVADMTLLTTISNDSVNENLQKRWTNAEIYTYIGSVLISVNPFRDLGIYTDEVLDRYRGKNRLEVPPHVFGIAESAYYNMNAYHENQCVIITGESGAGKTEAAKRIMQYIAAVSGGQDSGIQEIKDMVLATNPLLESFGCAKTLRNNNSSRHGKYLEIMFNDRGEPVGAQITNYLLEKGRVVGQIDNERNFHIFYQFTKAATGEQREAFGLQGPDAYAYTNSSNCLDVQDVDDSHDYQGTLTAMQVIGLSAEEQNEIFKQLATILWLGNVEFDENEEGHSTIADTGVTDFVAYLMEVDSAAIQTVLTSRIVETGGKRGSVYAVPLNPAQASSGRDALAKAIYNNVFEWIVSRINVSLKTRSAYSQVIGILDIFGFEIFEDNSFEQLCINYVNEKLQQIFIELTLKTEQEEYVREQIKWTPIKFFNNKIVCDLIEERRPPGIFAALNDACATAHADPSAADNSFIQRSAGLSSNPHFEPRGSQFLIKHYAGDVYYKISGMTDKNKDSLIKDILDVIATSSSSFLQNLFPDRPDPNSKKRPPTASDRIKQSAGALVEKLMKAQPSYIRTIKPNGNRSPSEYDTKAILHQIKYLGLQENIRVRRAGFAYRNTFEKMVERFYLLSPKTSYAGEYIWTGDAKSGCEQILKDTGIAKDEWQMGMTKAFIKNPETLFALETMRDRYWHNMAARIQRAFRNYMRYKHECARRIQRFWKNNKEGLVYAQVREYGHQLLAGRKERRRFSLLSYRRFMGDYIDVKGKSSIGEEISEPCNLGRDEPVVFSARGQLLVSKTGRSSKPSPRFIIMTGKAVYLVVATAKDGQNYFNLDRKIPLVTIKSIQMSTLRDDWFTLSLGPTEEGDPVLSCIFKTEFTTHLMQLTQTSANLTIASTLEYCKKKEKKAQVKFLKDETIPRDDVYKSHTVHVPTGEPSNSVSRPAAKRKAGVVRPITQGKLLRAGGPSKPNNSRPRPTAQPLPGQSSRPTPSAPPKASTPAVSSTIKSAPTPVVRSTPAAQSSTMRAPPTVARQVPAPPPPPPPPAAEPEKKMYRAKFNFEGQEGEMSLQKDEEVELIEESDNGWWLVKKDGVEAWAPYNYLELVTAKAAPPPPPPPSRPRPTSTVPKPAFSSTTANASAKPVSVFPGMAANNGSSSPWKKTVATANSTPDSSRPSSSSTKVPPPVAAKPKPPVVAPKPGAPKPAGKSSLSTTSRPVASGRPGGGGGGAPGQMDLAAALAKRAQRIADED